MEKTLIGKDEYLFLKNDSANEIEVHCNNLCLVSDINLSRYNFHNFFMVVFPNKSLIYKKYLPDNFIIKYRPALDIYKEKFKNRLLDGYTILQDINDTYYKTDSHINLKGNYEIYKNFIDIINKLYNLNFEKKQIDIQSITTILNKLPFAIGDLTQKINLGNQVLKSIEDTFYFSNDFEVIYNKYNITSDGHLRFLDYELNDKTNELKTFLHWEIISNYIIHSSANDTNKFKKILVFYDSFLLNILRLYIETFNNSGFNVYFSKTIYNNELINKINPDYVFEFRVERFLF
jgi:hypothetical protein